MPDTLSTLAASVRDGYARGWAYTPLQGKRPTLKGWNTRPRASLDESLAWAAAGNVGVRTGAASGGLVAIDADEGADLASLNLPPTLTVETGRNGIHLYYHAATPVANSSGKLGPHIDVRGEGGQVVAAGCIHPDTGKPYVCVSNDTIAELPQRILAALAAPTRPAAPEPARTPTRPVPAATRACAYVRVALKMAASNVASAAEGTRNDALNKEAYSLGGLVGGGALTRVDAETELERAAAVAGLPDAEARRTIRSGLDAGILEPRTVPERAPRDAPAVRIPREDYVLVPGPHVDGDGVYTEQSTASYPAAVLAKLPSDTIYRKDFLPGEILGAAGKRRWVALEENRTRLVVDTHIRAAKWVRSRTDGEPAMVYVPTSKDHAGLVIAAARQAPGIRGLDLMVSYPVYGPGFVRVEPGWHDGVYYDEPPDLQGLEPVCDCEVIHNALEDLVVDFPFKSPADRENFFGLLVTPFVAPALDGNRPLHMILSPLERTGKTKLAEEVFGGVIIGRQTPAMQITDREEERDKRVLGLLLQGETLLHLDNLPVYIESGALSSLLTATTYAGRILGSTKQVNLPNCLTIVASGNNVQANGELLKRTVPIVLQPTQEDPEARTGFQHPDLRDYIRGERRHVIACVLGMVENWIAAGKPKHASLLGSFESWAAAIGAILACSGFRAWRTNDKEWRKKNDPKGMAMAAFIAEWWDTWHDAEVAPQDLRDLAEKGDHFDDVFGRKNEKAISTAFGTRLRPYIDRPVSGKIVRYVDRSGRRAYRLEAIL
jgi:hypothetical protein